MRLPRDNKLLNNAKDLRKNMTREEKHLWYDFLSKYPIRFRRQEIINNYIVDFYCHKAKLVIEIDGLQHCDSDAVVVYDEKRTEYLKSLGLEVLRIPNIDIRQNFDDVCIEIERIIAERIEQIENKSSKLKPPLKGRWHRTEGLNIGSDKCCCDGGVTTCSQSRTEHTKLRG